LETGEVKGVKAKVQELNPKIRLDNCFTRREAVVAKT
jgi:hypothetical protein